jgi:hypothetical protein
MSRPRSRVGCERTSVPRSLRATAVIRSARESVSGAPHAVQIADRFRLMRNVVDAVDEVQRQLRADGSAAFGHGVRAPPPPKAEPPPLPDPALLQSKPGERLRSFRAGPYQWERARALRAQNWTVQAIGQAISLSPKSVRRLLKRDTPPPQEYVQLRRVPRLVKPSLPYLLQRRADGCQNGSQLTREIEQLRYRGKGSAVRLMISRWRALKAAGSAGDGCLHVTCHGYSFVHRSC